MAQEGHSLVLTPKDGVLGGTFETAPGKLFNHPSKLPPLIKLGFLTFDGKSW